MLKVKHGGNPAFAFLLIDNPLQSYYQAILGHFKTNPEAATLNPSLLPPEMATDKVEHSSSENRSDVESCKKGAASNSSEITEPNLKEVKTVPAIDMASKAVDIGACESSAKQSRYNVSCSGSNGPKKDECHAPKHPPPEMMMTIEKLVEWIRKSGLEFEAKVKERQRGDPRFEFLQAWNPYNAYYRWRLQACLNEAAGKDEAALEGAQGANRTEQRGLVARDEPVKAQDAGEEEQHGAARGPDEEDYNPHAITVVQSITSFGGEDSSAEEETVGEGESSEARVQSGGEGGDEAPLTVIETSKGSKGKRRTRWEEKSVATGEEDVKVVNQGHQVEELPMAHIKDEGLSDSERKAARLLRVKMLAQRLQAGTPEAARAAPTETRQPSAEQPPVAQAPNPTRPPANPKSRSRSRSRSAEGKRSRSAEGRVRGKSSKHKRKRSRDASSERDSRERPASRAHRSKSRSRSRERSRDRSRDRSHSRERSRKSSKSGSKKHSSKHRKSTRKHKKSNRSRDHSESADESASRPRSNARAASRELSAAAAGPTSLRAESPGHAREAGPAAGGSATSETGPDVGVTEEGTTASAVAAATLERLEVGDDLRDKVRAMLSLSAPPRP